VFSSSFPNPKLNSMWVRLISKTVLGTVSGSEYCTWIYVLSVDPRTVDESEKKCFSSVVGWRERGTCNGWLQLQNVLVLLHHSLILAFL